MNVLGRAAVSDEVIIESQSSRQDSLKLIETRAFDWGTGYVLRASDGCPIYTTDKRLFDTEEGELQDAA